MGKNWLVIAHRAGARIFARGADARTLELVDHLDNPEAHQHEREFGSDRPGRSVDSSRHGHHAMSNETPARDASAQKFARRIAERLEAARVAHELGQLALVAEPHMLGLLREALTPHTAALVSAELEKDLVHVADKDLPAYLEQADFWI